MEKAGVGQRVQACLSRSGGLTQFPFMLDYEGKVWDEPAGPEAKGYGPLDRIFRTADGWFYLVAESPAALRAIPLLSGLPEEPEELAKALETMVSRGGTDAWLEVLKAPGVWARRCRRYQGEPPEEDYAKARGLTKREYHPGVGILRTTHGAPRLSLTLQASRGRCMLCSAPSFDFYVSPLCSKADPVLNILDAWELIPKLFRQDAGDAILADADRLGHVL